MSVLSAQSIRNLCTRNSTDGWYHCRHPSGIRLHFNKSLITPFDESSMINGRSAGLSACSYDCRISDGLLLPYGGRVRLASTMEYFNIPSYICASVLDKSTHARRGISAFNTHLDPGWSGYLTVELVNFGDEAFELAPGDPLVQIKFEWLDEPTELPYRGKYQNQESGPQGAR
jgi:dCTP deaminase